MNKCNNYRYMLNNWHIHYFCGKFLKLNCIIIYNSERLTEQISWVIYPKNWMILMPQIFTPIFHMINLPLQEIIQRMTDKNSKIMEVIVRIDECLGYVTSAPLFNLSIENELASAPFIPKADSIQRDVLKIRKNMITFWNKHLNKIEPAHWNHMKFQNAALIYEN